MIKKPNKLTKLDLNGSRTSDYSFQKNATFLPALKQMIFFDYKKNDFITIVLQNYTKTAEVGSNLFARYYSSSFIFNTENQKF